MAGSLWVGYLLVRTLQFCREQLAAVNYFFLFHATPNRDSQACRYGGLFVPFRYFVLSSFRLVLYGAAPRRNNVKRKDEITKKRQAK